MNISELMNRQVVSVSPTDMANAAARLMYRYNVGALPIVTDEGELRGIVTDRDIALRCVAADRGPMATMVGDIMTHSVQTVEAGADVRAAARIMAEKKVRRLPVTENGALVGMVSLGDIAKARSSSMEASRALTEISGNVKRA